MKTRILLIWLAMSPSLIDVAGQTGTIKGFVYEFQTGQAIPMASVTISNTTIGQATDQNGFFLLTKVPVGTVTLQIRYLGYADNITEVNLSPGETRQITVFLKPTAIELEAATISGERQRLERVNPVSVHRLTPVTLQRIPGLSGQADLAEYLQVLPGIIFTGDRGGQFYVRGGEPVNNLVKLDGMTVINPFHSVGFTSVFDTQTISSVDVSTAGFGASYGGRISSVIDVRTRVPNRREFSADASANTFGYGVIFEGPVKKITTENPSSISVLFSNKGSYIRKTADLLYPYLDSIGLPYRFDDYFGKLSFVGKKGDQLDLMAMHFSDIADYGSLMRSTWTNNGGGAHALISPQGSPLLFESNLYLSDYRGQLDEEGERPRKTLYNSVEAAFRVHYNGPVLKFIWGTEMNVMHTSHTFQGLSGITQEDEYFTTEILTYIETGINLGRFLLEPGFRLNYYADRNFLSPEPRLKIRFKISDRLNLNFAGGFYSQNLVSTTSTEDVVNIFQGYYIGPFWVKNDYKGTYIVNKFQLARHAVAGISYLGPKNLKLTAEIYVKDYYRMINYNRYRMYDEVLWKGDSIWQAISPILCKYFIIEKGLAYGLDLLADWTWRDLSLYASYSLGYVFREDDYVQYIPHFDRRHNLNLIAGYTFGKKKGLERQGTMESGLRFSVHSIAGYLRGS
ncbi:MAG: TonB-dependent receptor [Bacteroidota bacterium]